MHAGRSNLLRRDALTGGLAALLASACTRPAGGLALPPVYPEPTEAAIRLGLIATDFGERLLDQLTVGDPNSTTLISPLSLLLPLIVLGLGARGDTAAAIASGLGFSAKTIALSDADCAYANLRARLAAGPLASLGLANGIWVSAKAGPDPAFAVFLLQDWR